MSMSSDTALHAVVDDATADAPADPSAVPPTDDAEPWTLLCVDDEPNILAALQRVFRGSGYRVLIAQGADEALRLLARETVQLVISDMRMPGMDGAQMLAQVRETWPAITRVLLTGHSDVAATIAAINRGEIFRYLTKPWHEQELRGAAREDFARQALLREQARLERLVAAQHAELVALNAGLEQQVVERTTQLTDANARLARNHLHSIKAFSNLIELRGGAMAGHSRRVAELARRIANAMQLPAAEAQDIFVAGLLHDIGQVGLPDAVLACPVPRMTVEDRALYVRHAALGEQALLALDDMQRVAALVRSHHERHDGQGFPEGLAGNAIPLGAAILAIVDTFDDLQSGHLARSELSADEARMLVMRGRGSQFDPAVVDAFAEVTRVPDAPPAFVELTVDRLRPGMRLARDLRSRDGVVLLAAEHVLSADLIRRIAAHAERHGLALTIPVLTGDPVAAERAATAARIDALPFRALR